MSRVECIVCGLVFSSMNSFSSKRHSCYKEWGNQLVRDQSQQHKLDVERHAIEISEVRYRTKWSSQFEVPNVTFNEVREAQKKIPESLQKLSPPEHEGEPLSWAHLSILRFKLPSSQHKDLEKALVLFNKSMGYRKRLIEIELLVMRGVPRALAELIEDVEDQGERKKLIRKFLSASP
jgi:hypothetical protein